MKSILKFLLVLLVFEILFINSEAQWLDKESFIHRIKIRRCTNCLNNAKSENLNFFLTKRKCGSFCPDSIFVHYRSYDDDDDDYEDDNVE